MTALEKTPVLQQCKKTPFGDKLGLERTITKPTRVILSCIFAAVLFLLVSLLIVQFFYSPFEHDYRVWTTHSIDVETIIPKSKDNDSSFIDDLEVTSLDPWELDFLIDPRDLCATQNPPDSEEYAANPEVKLLVIIPSATDHFEQRKAIRNSWGCLAAKQFGPMRLAFVLGLSLNYTINELVEKESLVYRDIVQAEFIDSYRQLTTKGIVMLKWVAKRCAHARYFIKAEDDTFVNLANIARILTYEPYVSTEKFITGFIHTDVGPQREPEETFYVPTDDYLSDSYPPFASGSAYVMTIPTAIELFEASKKVKPILPCDDVFLTGLCAQLIGAPLFHEPSFVISDPPNPASWQAFSSLATAHSVRPDTLEMVWNDMTQSVADSLFLVEAAINATVIHKMDASP